MSQLAEPIRPFNWGPGYQQAFTQMKKGISSVPVLAYYNPKKQTTLQTDGSIKGLGTCLLQDDTPVYLQANCSGLGNGEIP